MPHLTSAARTPVSLDATFAALADPTRRAIVARLSRGEATVGELAEPFKVSLPAISRHLRVLERASLLIQRREGKHRFCRLDARALTDASEWLDVHRRFWTESFDRLDTHLRQHR